MVNSDALFWYQLLLPFCDPSKVKGLDGAKDRPHDLLSILVLKLILTFMLHHRVEFSSLSIISLFYCYIVSHCHLFLVWLLPLLVSAKTWATCSGDDAGMRGSAPPRLNDIICIIETFNIFKAGVIQKVSLRSPGIEPGASAWKAEILPLNYNRRF